MEKQAETSVMHLRCSAFEWVKRGFCKRLKNSFEHITHDANRKFSLGVEEEEENYIELRK